MYLCIAKDTTAINGYRIGKGELVQVKYINIEVGVRTMISFTDMHGTRFTLDAKYFYERFELDTGLPTDGK